ncbi:MAG: hypothetical protein HY565_03900 [Candidatus Kerfeldbacteria bacterium]|nr:hypothetical protein [Candidatus Kerfeldbacteria bacterium]
MLKQLLQSKRFPHYIRIVEELTGQPDHLASFEQAQQAAWQTAMQQLGITAQANDIQPALQYHTTVLGGMVNDVVGTFSWESVLSLLRPHLAAAVLECYAIKPAVLQRLLEAHPPQHVLAHLGYTTVAQCLQQEPLFEIMAALRFAENHHWMETFLRSYQVLTAADFERRPVQFLTLEPAKWWKLAEPFALKKKHHFSHLKEAGIIFWYPSPQSQQLQDQTLIVLFMLLHYLYEVHFYSRWFEHSVKQDSHFSAVFIDVLRGDTDFCAVDDYHLPIIQQYHLKTAHPNSCALEPHVMPEALHWRKAMTTFFALLRHHPQYHRVAFWETCYTVAESVQGKLVTLNIVDNVLSEHRQFTYHWREDMWNALFVHYFGQATLERSIIHHLANKQIDLKALSKTL